MNSGVYGITNSINGKRYVGSSSQLSRRKAEHFRALRRGRHYNAHLQRSFSKYGESAFVFEILEYCDKSFILEREQYWIDHSESLMNIREHVVDLQGARNPFFGKQHTETTKKKQSVAKLGRYKGSNNPNFGKTNSLEVRAKMSLGRSSKLNAEKVLHIVDLLRKGLAHQEVADRLDISRTVVTRISNGTRWTNVTGGPVRPTTYVNGVRQFSEAHKQRIGQKRMGQKHTEATKVLMRERFKKRSHNG